LIHHSNASSTDCHKNLELIFVVDSSGSVYNDGYVNWGLEIATVKDVINTTLPYNSSRVGLINFSGCGDSFTVEQCKAQNRLKRMFGLDTFGTPFNNLSAVYNRVNKINSSDFNGGYTWTDQALEIALEEFKNYSLNETNTDKLIVLITDGEPYPYNQDPPHEPCKASTGYVSKTLMDLRELNVKIIAVGIGVTPSVIDDFFTCIVNDFETDFLYVSNFSELHTHFTQYFKHNLYAYLGCGNYNDTMIQRPNVSIPTESSSTTSPDFNSSKADLMECYRSSAVQKANYPGNSQWFIINQTQPAPTDITFEACNSDFQTKLEFYHNNGTELGGMIANVTDGCTEELYDGKSKMHIQNLSQGTYYLKLECEAYCLEGQFVLQMVCYETNSGSPSMLPTKSSSKSNHSSTSHMPTPVPTSGPSPSPISATPTLKPTQFVPTGNLSTAPPTPSPGTLDDESGIPAFQSESVLYFIIFWCITIFNIGIIIS